MKSSIFISAIFLLIANYAMSQYTIYGRVYDDSTHEPLKNASVFCQNSTLGTLTNAQGKFRLDVPKGDYNLVVSFVGYAKKEMKIDESTAKDSIVLGVGKEQFALEDVVVVGTSNFVKDGLEKYGSFFEENFIGTTSTAKNCKLTNPEVLKFYYYAKKNKLKVKATAPLLIDNFALGYKIRYELDSFIYDYNSVHCKYRGSSLYSEMEGTEKEKINWLINRKKLYQGSQLQFMRSYYDSTLAENGFIIDTLDAEKNVFIKADAYDSLVYGWINYAEVAEQLRNEKIKLYEDSLQRIQDSVTQSNIVMSKDTTATLVDNIVSQIIQADTAKKVAKVDTLVIQNKTYPFDDEYKKLAQCPDDLQIFYPMKFSITYTKQKPDSLYLQKMKLPKYIAAQITYIEMPDYIIIKENGYFYDPKNWLTQGYWSWKNIADQLPMDYYP